MNLQERIDLLVKLGIYLRSDDEEWLAAKTRAFAQNGWFSPAFINLAVENIVARFLASDALTSFVASYAVPTANASPKKIGLVMAGNIPLVGFHDWLCIFLSGHDAVVKPSSKDTVLITQIVKKLAQWNPAAGTQTIFSDMLKGCDAYIATGSNNSARFFNYYFRKYPHIIRRNRTSVAVLTGEESAAELDKLADDVNLYYGLGCRNVTKLYVPAGYDFVPVLEHFKKYIDFADNSKYKNNYDYQLAIVLLNHQYYMTNDAILLVENPGVFSPISVLHYEFYTDSAAAVADRLQNKADIQCIVGRQYVPFGEAQNPALPDFADGVDTMRFLLEA